MSTRGSQCSVYDLLDITTKKKKWKSGFRYRSSTCHGKRNCCQLLRVQCVAWRAQQIPTTVNLGLLNWKCYLFFQVPTKPNIRNSVWRPIINTPYPEDGERMLLTNGGTHVPHHNSIINLMPTI